MSKETANKTSEVVTAYEQTVSARYLHMTPRKVRLIADTIRGLPANEAEAHLTLRTQRAAEPILKLLRSAIANAKTNKNIEVDKLFIKGIAVGQGPRLKRFMPRAFGRATEIHKKMSHLWLTLALSKRERAARFIMVKPEKKTATKGGADKRTSKDTDEEKAKPAGQNKKGAFKRFFQRKAV